MKKPNRKRIKHVRFISKLACTKTKKQRKELLEKASCGCISEIITLIVNFLRKKIAIPKKNIKFLKRHYSKILKKLSKIRSERKAKNLLIQHGGFASSLFVPILAALAEPIINKAISQLL